MKVHPIDVLFSSLGVAPVPWYADVNRFHPGTLHSTLRCKFRTVTAQRLTPISRSVTVPLSIMMRAFSLQKGGYHILQYGYCEPQTQEDWASIYHNCTFMFKPTQDLLDRFPDGRYFLLDGGYNYEPL